MRLHLTVALTATIALSSFGVERACAFDEKHLAVLLETNSCPGCDLRMADLRETTLVGADLAGAQLQNAKLGGANLDAAKLSHANMVAADLWGRV